MAPVTLVALENVTKALGTRTLLDGVTLGVTDGARIGVVGRNGGGKTTLVRVLTGLEPPDDGRVVRAGGVTVGVLAQADDLDPGLTLREVVVGDRPEHEWAGDARVRDVLDGLIGGVDATAYTEGLATTYGSMSGGEKRRAGLARVLVADPDLLVLDEPTNHLDVEAIAWLARHLARRRGALLAVTHDRWFLDAVATDTWEVVDATVQRYEGGYAAFVLAKAERSRQAASSEERRQNLLRKELAWLRRGAPARTSKPKFRIEAANELIADEPPPRDRLELERFATARLGKQVFDVEDLTLAPAAGADPVLTHQTWRLGPGDRVGVLGPNGAGKTTLLRLLAAAHDGVLDSTTAPDVRAGIVRVGRTVQAAMLSQTLLEVDGSERVLEAVQRQAEYVEVGGRDAASPSWQARLAAGGATRSLTARSLLEGFGFTGDRLSTRVGDLSGGERRRLQLLRLLVAGPNVLLLDEPTNDLDVEMLTVLEDLLDTWPGTLVVVSHDRYFLERTTDTVVALLGDATLRHLPRGVDEYLERRAGATGSPTPGTPSTGGGATPSAGRGATPSVGRGATSPGTPSPGRGTTSPGPASAGRGSPPPEGAADASGGAAVALTGGEARELRKELARIERRTEKLRAEEERLHGLLAEAATDHERVLALDAELRALTAERADLEDRWLDLATRLDP